MWKALNKYWVFLYKEVECLKILAFGGVRRLLEIAPDDPPWIPTVDYFCSSIEKLETMVWQYSVCLACVRSRIPSPDPSDPNTHGSSLINKQQILRKVVASLPQLPSV